jgi:hypothetical protein
MVQSRAVQPRPRAGAEKTGLFYGPPENLDPPWEGAGPKWGVIRAENAQVLTEN